MDKILPISAQNGRKKNKHIVSDVYSDIVTADILAHQVLLNRVPEQATEDSVRYKIYY